MLSTPQLGRPLPRRPETMRAVWTYYAEYNLWTWTPAIEHYSHDLVRLNSLRAAHFQPVPRDDIGRSLLAHHGQMYPVVSLVHTLGERESWVSEQALERLTQVPVALAFTLPEDVAASLEAIAVTIGATPEGEPRKALRMAQWLPPPQFGERALMLRDGDVTARTIAALGDDARTLLAEMGRRLTEMAEPAGWGPWHEGLEYSRYPGDYKRRRSDLRSQLLARQGQAREDVRAELELFGVQRKHALDIEAQEERQARDPEAWRASVAEVAAMAQQLADLYWQVEQEADERATQRRADSLPPLTSAHRTFIPSHNAARGLLQTFGPGVQQSLWNVDPNNQTIELKTPNQSLVRVTPQEDPELSVLHRYVREGLTTEGVKHMVGVLSAYADQTGGAGQKIDARVSMRQLLLHMGKPESHAENPEEQRRVYQTVLYLARCLVHASDRPEDPRLPGSYRRRKGKEYREYSPMLVIERVQFEEDGTLRVPREVTFHLGADYYHLLFGQGRSYFTIPTAQVLSYHPDREQQEILLSMYLSDMLAWNRNPWRVTFHTLMLQSALRSEEELAHGRDRTRDALRVLLALERLERDGLLFRAAHADVDTALACALALGNITRKELAEATCKRLAEPPYRSMLQEEADQTQIARSRRLAIQSLLDGKAASLALSAGPLLREQVEQRATKRKEAAAQDERALAARVVKNATQIIVDAAQNTGQAESTKPGAKRRGRPRKSQ